MKVSVEKLEGSKVVLTIEAPSSVVDESLDKAYKSVVRRVNIPGFRRGKAPRFIVERYYGKEVLYEEAMKEVLPDQYLAAVEEAKIDPVDEPEFDEINFKQGEPLTFKATVYVRPEVTLENYDDLSVPYEVQPVTDEDVEQQISFLRERMAELSPMADGEALEQGDYATCHVTGIEGGSFKAEIDQDLSYVEVGREYGIVPGLSEALTGMKKGETKEFAGTYPAEEGEEPKDAKFSLEVKDCYRKKMPSDEEFLKNLGKDSIDDVKADIKQRLEAMRTDTARRIHSQKVEEAALAKGKVEIPGPMIERREQELLQRFAERLQEANTSFDAYLKSTGKTVDDLRNEFHAEAEKDVRRELVLDAIADKENTEVPEEAMNSVVEAFARQMGKDADTVRTTLQFRGALDSVRSDLRRLETMKALAIKAADKAGTPLPLDKVEEVKPEEGAEASDKDRPGAAPEAAADAEAPAKPEPEAVAEKAEAAAKPELSAEAVEPAKPEPGTGAEAEVAATESDKVKAAPKRRKKAPAKSE
ncbi:MAG: trigger factor [Bacillota bacterium]